MAIREITDNNQRQIRKWHHDDIFSDCAIVVIIASFITALRPFGMNEVSMFYAWFFWLTTCLTGYVIYSPVIYFLEWLMMRFLSAQLSNPWLRLIISTIVASGLMSLVAPIIILSFFSLYGTYWQLVPRSIIPSLVIGGMITFLATIKGYLQQQKELINQQQELLEQSDKEIDAAKNEALNQFLTKLPIEKRGQLLCMQMDDHYLHVHTDKGSHMVLMRFKDAINSVGENTGFQTHRSWWVATDAIKSSKKEGRKLILQLTNDIEVPVSKTYLETVKAFV